MHAFRRHPGLLALALLACPALAGERQQQLEDIETVRTQYLLKEMAYTPATRVLAEVLLAYLAARAGEMSSIEFLVAMSEVSALTDNAHSGLHIKANVGDRLPLRLLWMPDGLIVARAAGINADLAGATVLKVEGRSPGALFEGAKVLLGGNEAGRKHWLNRLIEVRGVLHALGLAASPDAVAMTLRLRDGRVVDRTVAMVGIEETGPTADGARLWSPRPVTSEKGWLAALKPAGLPLYLQDPDRPFRTARLPSLHAFYIQFRSNEDEEGYPIRPFLAAVERQIAVARPRNLVVDLRFDEGGNLSTTLDFMRTLAKRVPGRTYLLVGPYTFSAGIISAAALKQGGGDRVTIVGAPVGDRLHFWSEGDFIVLPNSGLRMRYTDGQFNLVEGCTGEPGCMDDQFRIDVNFVPLDPDLPAPLTAAAWFAGRDPAMEAIAKDLRFRTSRK